MDGWSNVWMTVWWTVRMYIHMDGWINNLAITNSWQHRCQFTNAISARERERERKMKSAKLEWCFWQRGGSLLVGFVHQSAPSASSSDTASPSTVLNIMSIMCFFHLSPMWFAFFYYLSSHAAKFSFFLFIKSVEGMSMKRLNKTRIDRSFFLEFRLGGLVVVRCLFLEVVRKSLSCQK